MNLARRLPWSARESAACRARFGRRPSALVPAGTVVEDARQEGEVTVITVRAAASEAACPSCGALARRVHSRYVRTLADLPLSGRVVRLQGKRSAATLERAG